MARSENDGAKNYETHPVQRVCRGDCRCVMTLIGTAHAGIPVSTTHVITGAIVGVGASRRITSVRWGVTGRIMWAWVLTIPGAGVMGALFYLGLRHWMH